MNRLYFLLLVLMADFSWARTTYRQRFMSSMKYQQKVNGKKSVLEMTMQRFAKRYPWLSDLQQPTVEFDFSRRLDDYGRQEQMHRLPDVFLSQRRTIWHYADGSQAMHTYVSADDLINFQKFLARTRDSIPIVVVTRDPEKEITGRYLYTERSFFYIYNQLKTADFSIHNFLEEIEPPLANMAAGGVELSRSLSINATKPLDVFSIDVSGSNRTYQSNPYYLFANIEQTGIPDNVFGAILSLGGPLALRHIDEDQARIILKELVRITKPGGRLLIEYTTPRHVFIRALEEVVYEIADADIYPLVSSSGKPIAEVIDIFTVK